MYENLIATIAISRVSKSYIAKTLDIDRSTLENKLRGTSKFSVSEMFFIHQKFFPNKDEDWLFERIGKEAS